jgi:hypothetical protein
MSFISTKVNIKLGERQKERLNAKLKQVIGCQESETEFWSVIEIQDGVNLHYQNNEDEPAAYIEVKIFDEVTARDCASMTDCFYKIYEQELGIPKDRVDVTYCGMEDPVGEDINEKGRLFSYSVM